MNQPPKQRIQDLERGTKIIATIGPSCDSEECIEMMIKAGMNGARLNFSHGDIETHKLYMQKIRKISEKLETPVSILVDLPGPKIRVGKFKDGKPIELHPGDTLTITTDASFIGDVNDKKVSCTYKDLAKDVINGEHILMDDGKFDLVITEKRIGVSFDEVECVVLIGGKLKQNKGMNLPNSRLSTSSLTQRDQEILRSVLNCNPGPDYICISFVTSKNDILEAKEIMKECGKYLPIISKIERPEALKNIHEIMEVTDGVMVARGDLGIETDISKLPLVQKDLIRMSFEKGKIDITATQMLDSMVKSPIPTRSEVTDIANAIFDGTDVIMLSNETAAGKFPVLSVEMMAKCAKVADMNYSKYSIYGNSDDVSAMMHPQFPLSTRASCLAAYIVAQKFKEDVKLIVSLTASGKTAFELSQLRITQPVIAITADYNTYHQMALYWGVVPIFMQNPPSNNLGMEDKIKDLLLEKNFIKEGENFLLTTGQLFVTGGSNTVKLLQIPSKNGEKKVMV